MAQGPVGFFSSHKAAQPGGGTGTDTRPQQLPLCQTAETLKWKKAPHFYRRNCTQSLTFHLKGEEEFLLQHLS